MHFTISAFNKTAIDHQIGRAQVAGNFINIHSSCTVHNRLGSPLPFLLGSWQDCSSPSLISLTAADTVSHKGFKLPPYSLNKLNSEIIINKLEVGEMSQEYHQAQLPLLTPELIYKQKHNLAFHMKQWNDVIAHQDNTIWVEITKPQEIFHLREYCKRDFSYLKSEMVQSQKTSIRGFCWTENVMELIHLHIAEWQHICYTYPKVPSSVPSMSLFNHPISKKLSDYE